MQGLKPHHLGTLNAALKAPLFHVTACGALARYCICRSSTVLLRRSPRHCMLSWRTCLASMLLSFCFSRLQRFPILVGEGAAEVAEFSGALQEFSTVHADDFSVDVAGAVADQKCGEVGQLLRGAEAVERIAVEREGFELGARHQARECALRRNGAGSDGVHADSTIAPLDSETAGERFDSGF